MAPATRSTTLTGKKGEKSLIDLSFEQDSGEEMEHKLQMGLVHDGKIAALNQAVMIQCGID